MRPLITAIDRLSGSLAQVAKVMLAVLVCAMLYEVFARYVLAAPTLWAFDISYMLNGSLFLLAGGYALRHDAHVRIDFLAQRMPPAVRNAVNGIAYLGVLLPIFGALTWIALANTWKAYVTGEVEAVSPWAPYVWPFYGAIAVGLLGLSLQFVAEGLRYVAAISSGEVAAMETGHE